MLDVLDTPEVVEAPEETKELTVADVLYKAADLISQPGKWCKGAGHRNGAYCAAGAMIVVGDPTFYERGMLPYTIPKHNRLYHRALTLTARVLGKTADETILRYNDNPYVGQSDVVDLLRKAGDLAVQEGL